jgi:hypothetical protein
MLWPLIVAVIFGLVAVALGLKKKGGWAIIPSIVSAIAFFVAYPDALQPDWLSLPESGTWIAGLIGIIVVLLAFAVEKFSHVLVYVGIVVILWAACRMVPTLPPAFAALGNDLTATGGDLWGSVKKFFTRATG